MAEEKINYMSMVVARKNKNTDRYGNNADSEFDTTDAVRLLSWDEMIDRIEEERRKSNTDFALINYAWQNNSYKAQNGKLSGAYWSRSANVVSYVKHVYYDGSRSCNSVDNQNLGSVPALSLNLQSFLSARSASTSEILETKKTKDGKEKHFLNIGEYPKTRANDELQQTLEERYNGGVLQGGLICTGRLFTTNGQRKSNEDFLSKQNPEFVYNGKKYVRSIVWRNDECVFGDGTAVPQIGAVIWMEVEPVTFEIINWDNLPKTINPKGKRVNADDSIELEAEEGVLSGLPFYPDWNHNNCSMWQNSLQRCFLNSGKSENLDRNSEFETQYKWDFSKSGFLYQALDLTREPTREYIIADFEQEIAPHAFEGCTFIEHITIPSHVTKIGKYAFDGCRSAQLIFQDVTSKLTLSEDALSGTDFGYIYLSKDGANVILSPYRDEQRHNDHYELAYDANDMNKYFHANFRKNYVQLKNWREEKKIKFIPPEYTMKVFPASNMMDYFTNNNNQRWGKLVKTIGFDTLEGTEKNNSLIDLMKIYYAIGGFSTNQGESEQAYEYVLNHVAKVRTPNATPSQVGAEIHARFTKLVLKGEYNPTFAKFFMKYYHDNPDFMNFRLPDKDGDLMDSQDYLCNAHNCFETILKNYPNRVVTGNEERALLTPRFVAEHSTIIEYEDVEEGNELLAETVGRYGYSQEQFDHIQETYDQAKGIKDKYVISADRAKENDCITFRVLEKDDPLGFVLGDITNCCQHIDGAGGSCVDDGYVNPNAGFLVFEESILDEQGNKTGETRILGQAYIWYDPVTKIVCYDNIEIPTKVLQELRRGDKHDEKISSSALLDAVVSSADAIMSSMNKKGVEVRQVTTGQGYNDLKTELERRFGSAKTKDLAKHRGYNGYTDADVGQYVIRTYDETTNYYREEILHTSKSIIDKLKDKVLSVFHKDDSLEKEGEYGQN